MPYYFSDNLKSLLKKILVFDPNSRSSLNDVLNHSWIIENT